MVGVAGFEPATPASRTQCISFKLLIFLAATGVSVSFCSRSFHPIRCDFVAASSGRTVSSRLGPRGSSNGSSSHDLAAFPECLLCPPEAVIQSRREARTCAERRRGTDGKLNSHDWESLPCGNSAERLAVPRILMTCRRE